MSYATDHFIAPLLVHFELRKHNPEQFLADLSDRLSRYDAKTLRAAAEELITNHDKTTFPSVTVCLRAIARHKPVDEANPSFRPFNKRPVDESAWNSLVACNLGIQAGEEGWINCLLAFVNRNGRLPMGTREVENIINESNRIFRTVLDAGPFAADMERAWHGRNAMLLKKARAAA